MGVKVDVDRIITEFSVEDFDTLTDAEVGALEADGWKRHELAKLFLEGLDWRRAALDAVEAWRALNPGVAACPECKAAAMVAEDDHLSVCPACGYAEDGP